MISIDVIFCRVQGLTKKMCLTLILCRCCTCQLRALSQTRQQASRKSELRVSSSPQSSSWFASFFFFFLSSFFILHSSSFFLFSVLSVLSFPLSSPFSSFFHLFFFLSLLIFLSIQIGLEWLFLISS